ncbi:hypothetical protein ACH44C_20840 [Streptomyces purpureus]|uniref:hypothetical protein n=1 Tax=Streptomyces purpureus TaxID=1951 RepID=UPI00379A8C0C
MVERQWKKRGYEITGTNSDKQFPAIFARTSDDFRMSVVVGAKGQFFFEVITPCFVDSEVEPPKTEDNGTPFEGSTVPSLSLRPLRLLVPGHPCFLHTLTGGCR